MDFFWDDYIPFTFMIIYSLLTSPYEIADLHLLFDSQTIFSFIQLHETVSSVFRKIII